MHVALVWNRAAMVNGSDATLPRRAHAQTDKWTNKCAVSSEQHRVVFVRGPVMEKFGASGVCVNHGWMPARQARSWWLIALRAVGKKDVFAPTPVNGVCRPVVEQVNVVQVRDETHQRQISASVRPKSAMIHASGYPMRPQVLMKEPAPFQVRSKPANVVDVA